MKEISWKITQNENLEIALHGRINSISAPEVEKELDNIRLSNPHKTITIDASDLEYISSAGLRIILRLFKSEKNLVINNVQPEVYDVFEMTGFTEMFEINKSFRTIDVSNSEVIGQGANGKVYRINPETIVKVYFKEDALPSIKHERELARKALIMGIPTAISFDIVKVDNYYGAVFELLDCQSLAQLIAKNPKDIDKYIGLSVDVLKKIHSTEVKPNELPDMRITGKNWASFCVDYLPKDVAEKMMKLFNDMPEDNHMIHGDFHIKNIMYQNGEVQLIDMDSLCRGHPVFEFAGIYNAYIGFNTLDHDMAKRFVGLDVETCEYIYDQTLKLYFGDKYDEKKDEVTKKASFIGFIRILRRTIRRNGLNDEEGKKLIKYCQDQISKLAFEIDSLIF